MLWGIRYIVCPSDQSHSRSHRQKEKKKISVSNSQRNYKINRSSQASTQAKKAQRSSQTPTTTAMSPSPLAILLLLAVAAPLAYGACEGEASLKGVANDVLLEYGLPKGLLPDSVVSYTFINATGDFKIELASSCYIWFGDHYTYFDKHLSGTISQGTIYNLSGIQAKKLFIWVYITSMVARPERGMIEFHAGFITEDVPMSLFQKVPVCSNGVGDQLRGAAGVMNLLPVAEV
ncbi:uncharacterized protein [Lolium perenne]|uniref:uncharacterized protein n=1 Tax=Lolium perenne TaxID=4522 RepID=UPI003A990F5A